MNRISEEPSNGTESDPPARPPGGFHLVALVLFIGAEPWWVRAAVWCINVWCRTPSPHASGRNIIARLALARLLETMLLRRGVFRGFMGAGGNFNSSVYVFTVSNPAVGLTVLDEVASSLTLSGRFATAVFDAEAGVYRTAQGIPFNQLLNEWLSPESLAREGQRDRAVAAKRAAQCAWLGRLHKRITDHIARVRKSS